MAALFVLLLHYNQSVGGYNFLEIAPFISFGHTGVDVFFILSGYILSYVYWQKLSNFSWKGVWNFFVLRFSRIYPAHIVALTFVVALYLLAKFIFEYSFNDPQNWVPEDLIYSITMTHGWGVTGIGLWNAPSWSVSSEWMAYLIFPFGFPILMRLGKALWIAICIILLVSIWWVYGAEGNDLSFSFTTSVVIFRILSEFWLGSIVFLLAGHTRPRISYDVLVIGILLLFATAPIIGLADYELIMLVPLLIIALHKCKGPVASLFSSDFLVFLGRISYSIYIIHFPVNIVLKYAYGLLAISDMGFLVNSIWYIGMIIVTIICGWVLHEFVEVPARRAISKRYASS